jgi:hypothetical protein
MTRDQARAKIDKALVGAKDALLKYGEAAGLSHLVAEDMAGAVGRQMRRAADIYAKPAKAPEFPPGWGKPTANARKFHYFEPRPETDGGMARSLCMGYGYFYTRGPLEAETTPSVDDCKECRKRLAKQKEEKA